MTYRSALAGVDIGGSGIRVRVQLDERRVDRQRSTAVPRHEGHIDIPALCATVVTELRPALAEIGTEAPDGLGIGMTGIPGLVDDSEDIVREVRAHLQSALIVLAGDAVTTHCGALGGEAGAVVAAGTGAVTLGTDLGNVWHQVDGWGAALGDEGSGAWIGQRGLQAALRSADGRHGGSEALYARMQEQFGEPLDVAGRIYRAESPAYELASFTPSVAAAARAGDAVASAIWQEAGERLGDAAVAAAHGLPPVISWGGGLFDVGEMLLDPFRAQAQRTMPSAELRPPVGSALDGALTLAQRAVDRRLASRQPYLFVHDARPCEP